MWSRTDGDDWLCLPVESRTECAKERCEFWDDSNSRCKIIENLYRRGIDILEFERQKRELVAKLREIESKLSEGIA